MLQSKSIDLTNKPTKKLLFIQQNLIKKFRTRAESSVKSVGAQHNPTSLTRSRRTCWLHRKHSVDQPSRALELDKPNTSVSTPLGSRRRRGPLHRATALLMSSADASAGTPGTSAAWTCRAARRPAARTRRRRGDAQSKSVP